MMVGEVPRSCGFPASPPSSAMSITLAPAGLEPILIAPIEELVAGVEEEAAELLPDWFAELAGFEVWLLALSEGCVQAKVSKLANTKKTASRVAKNFLTNYPLKLNWIR